MKCRVCGKEMEEKSPLFRTTIANTHNECYWEEFKKGYKNIQKLTAVGQLDK